MHNASASSQAAVTYSTCHVQERYTRAHSSTMSHLGRVQSGTKVVHMGTMPQVGRYSRVPTWSQEVCPGHQPGTILDPECRTALASVTCHHHSA